MKFIKRQKPSRLSLILFKKSCTDVTLFLHFYGVAIKEFFNNPFNSFIKILYFSSFILLQALCVHVSLCSAASAGDVMSGSVTTLTTITS